LQTLQHLSKSRTEYKKSFKIKVTLPISLICASIYRSLIGSLLVAQGPCVNYLCNHLQGEVIFHIETIILNYISDPCRPTETTDLQTHHMIL